MALWYPIAYRDTAVDVIRSVMVDTCVVSSYLLKKILHQIPKPLVPRLFCRCGRIFEGKFLDVESLDQRFCTVVISIDLSVAFYGGYSL